ncbi:PREDICTED: programmed cell death protein 5-like [Priapulus caudatus]|uniref:Programmed cell death protein 5-like n=1 Tax=Priapulus caudatus TaxID=37621 RepID=A0ABM1F9P1_PRICU|nr:PREDICTED: programmed cell death protein 5-like [Priapulus caudatus]
MDEELDSLRAKRLAELQQKHGRQGGAPGGGEDQQKRAAQEEEMKNNILSQVLTQSARARLNTIAIAKPEKAKSVEHILLNMATSGQIQQKLDEDQLKSLLEQISSQTTKQTTVKFDRKRAHMDFDDDF